MTEYAFPTISFRARCMKVVDGDTVDLYVDTGFHSFRQERFRLYGIDTPELRARDAVERAAARDAKDYMIELSCIEEDIEWPLRIETFRDPDSFGRYLAKIYVWEEIDGVAEEICINDHLVETGYAVYKHYK